MDMGGDVDNLKSLIQHAILAPSSHNTQPWRFRLTASSIELYADLERVLPINDPQNRELHISCGCALMNLRVAVANAGKSATVTMLQDASDQTLLARVTLQQAPADAELAELYDAVLLRRTYRNRFKKEPLEAVFCEQLCSVADTEQARLNLVVAEEQRDALIELVREGDSRQWQSENWRRELAQWLHSGRKGDGLAVPGLVAPLVRGVVRHFDMGKSVASQDSLLADESPTLVLLSTAGDTPRDWLQAGQALQRVLLEAQRHGVQASYLNQPIQLAELRPKLEQLLALECHAQILMRMGYPDELLPASPRRSLEEVMT